VLELYERYRQNPGSVDPATRKAFESWTPPSETADAQPQAINGITVQKIVGAANLAECIRRYGHLAAQLDPLGSPPIGDPSLSPGRARHHRRRPSPASRIAGRGTGRGYIRERLRGDRKAAAGLLLNGRIRLRACIRAGRTRMAAARRRVRTIPSADGRAERPKPCSTASHKSRCSSAFCSGRSPEKRASRSKASTCSVPVLDEIICGAADHGARHAVLGMAHRGRS
jgi:2-oxoglutarate dehydrogenase E1 component